MGWSQSINWESYQRTLKSCASPRQTPRFSFSKCPFCIKAKKELNDMGVPFTALDLDQMDQEVIRKECCCNILNLWNHKCKQSINGNSCKKKQKFFLDLCSKLRQGKELRAELAKKTKRTSMPNIFIAGEGIGGRAWALLVWVKPFKRSLVEMDWSCLSMYNIGDTKFWPESATLQQEYMD